MSNNNHRNNNTPSPEERGRMVGDAMKHLSSLVPTAKITPEQEIMERAKAAAYRVYALAKTVVSADTAKGGAFDRNAMDVTLQKLFLDSFHKWDKDELLFLVAVMHAEMVVAKLAEEQ